jgi:hypothetical protein
VSRYGESREKNARSGCAIDPPQDATEVLSIRENPDRARRASRRRYRGQPLLPTTGGARTSSKRTRNSSRATRLTKQPATKSKNCEARTGNSRKSLSRSRSRTACSKKSRGLLARRTLRETYGLREDGDYLTGRSNGPPRETVASATGRAPEKTSATTKRSATSRQPMSTQEGVSSC